MWFIVGGRTKVERIDGGREIQRRCDKCEKVTTFAECDVLDRIEVFFVSLLDTKLRRMVCMKCGEDVDMQEAPAKPKEASAARVTATAPKKPRADDPEIDDMLAALKAR